MLSHDGMSQPGASTASMRGLSSRRVDSGPFAAIMGTGCMACGKPVDGHSSPADGSRPRPHVGAGRTTSGLNTISTRKVKEVTVPLPPLALQQRFAQVVESKLALSAKITGQLSLSNAMFATLSQRAFRGEL